MLKSRKLRKLVVVLVAGATFSVAGIWSATSLLWITWDYQVLDIFYTRAIQEEKGPPTSPLPIFLAITDQTYGYFQSNVLGRDKLARLNRVLTKLMPQAVAYDIIFARPSNPNADLLFEQSIQEMGMAYLPVAFGGSDPPRAFPWEEGAAYDQLREALLVKPKETGPARPFVAQRGLLQADPFARAAFNFGHINVASDSDGVYRHVPLLVRLANGYIPSLPLAMFLDYANVTLDQVEVEWGNRVKIPATRESFLDEDVLIPIDDRGRTFIPFVRPWGEDFPQITAHTLLQNFEDESLRGNLAELIESRFVFIADLSQGASDVGNTPLEENVFLVDVHATLLNALLTNQFYREWNSQQSIITILFIGLALALAGLPKSNLPLFVTVLLIFGFLGYLTWYQLIHFALVPVTSLAVGTGFIFGILFFGLNIAITRDQAFIRDAFSRYLPVQVIKQLLENPENLKLGGEERVISVLFLDIANFTSISEALSPTQLVEFLNEFLTEITGEVLNQEGIIDKYQGDGLMAEFGAPLVMEDHADRAVRAGLNMQQRASVLRELRDKKGVPEMRCRIGINTGPMIIGNMGSDQVMDYTVNGDAVNLGSRLEGANKRYGTEIMISESTRQQLTPGLFKTRVLDFIKVKGKSKPVMVFEVVKELTGQETEDEFIFHDRYENGFLAYLNQDFKLARTEFERALTFKPGDPGALLMLERIDSLETTPLPEDWDGSVQLTQK